MNAPEQRRLPCREAEVAQRRYEEAEARTDRAEAALHRERACSESRRRAGGALAERLAKRTVACPYPPEDESCADDCPPPGARMMCWLKWSCETTCPARAGCGGECADCDLSAYAIHDEDRQP